MFGQFGITARVAAPFAGPIAGMILLLVTATVPAEAQSRGHGHGRVDMVVAESNFGNGTVTGAVREGRNGPQVQLPGRTWIDCVRSCSDTLRRQSVDFWQNQANGPDRGRGYLSWGRSY